MITIVALLTFILVFSVIFALILGLTIAASFLIIWLFPAVPFETGMIVGAICISCSAYLYIKFFGFMWVSGPPVEEDFYDENDATDNRQEFYILPSEKPIRKNKRRKR